MVEPADDYDSYGVYANYDNHYVTLKIDRKSRTFKAYSWDPNDRDDVYCITYTADWIAEGEFIPAISLHGRNRATLIDGKLELPAASVDFNYQDLNFNVGVHVPWEE